MVCYSFFPIPFSASLCCLQEAERAIQCLNGKLALSKKLVVRWAHAQVRVSVILNHNGLWLLCGRSPWLVQQVKVKLNLLFLSNYSSSAVYLPWNQRCSRRQWNIRRRAFMIAVFILCSFILTVGAYRGQREPRTNPGLALNNRQPTDKGWRDILHRDKSHPSHTHTHKDVTEGGEGQCCSLFDNRLFNKSSYRF